MTNLNIALTEGYQPYFKFTTGFEPRANITSTDFTDLGFVGYEYTVTFADGSKVVFGLADKNSPADVDPAGFDNVEHYHFSTDANGHRILNQGGSVSFKLYDPGNTLVVDSSGGDLGNISVFSSHFLDSWLADNNSIGPGQFTFVTSHQVIHGYGGRDNLTGGGGNDRIVLDQAGLSLLVGGPADGNPTGNDTFVFLPDVTIPGDSQRSITVAGTDLVFATAPLPGEVNTIEDHGNNDFSLVDFLWINAITFKGAATLEFAAGNFFSNNHIAPDTTVTGGAGPDIFRVWMNPADIAPGHGSERQTSALDLSGFTFTHWSASADKVIIVADTINFAGTPVIVAPDVATRIIGAGNGEVLTGGAGSDTLLGGGGADTISGGLRADIIRGGVGNDLLAGNKGYDTLDGGDGADTLTGGAGNDRMTGGKGADTFVFADGFGNDTITDFKPGNLEKIDLSGLSGITSFGDLIHSHLFASGGFALIVDGTNSILLNGVTPGQVGHGLAYSAADFIF